MKKTLLLWLFGLLLTTQVFAQNRSLSGTVKDDKGEPLIGVNVTGKGTTIGTVTDIDGKYKLELPKDVSTLVFSYIGYTNLEKPILSLKIDAVMAAEGQVLQETVITAVAVKREKRSTSYATQTVKSDDLNQTASTALTALQGKAAGVRVTQGNGQLGSSSRVVLRSEVSISGDNNALLVVDGIPINNRSSKDDNNFFGGSGFADLGNRANDFNPDDIESVTVLKGPSATALYGSRAASGVLLITTKKGAKAAKDGRKVKVSFGTGMSFDKAYLMYKRQNQYGEGFDNRIVLSENLSWGPKVDGIVRPWTNIVTDVNGNQTQLFKPYSAIKNQMENFFDLGITNTNNLSIEGGTDKFNYRVSYGNTNNKATVPYNYFKRHNISIAGEAKLSDKIETDFTVTYSKSLIRTNTAGSNNTNQPLAVLTNTPIDIPVSDLRDFNNPYYGPEGYYTPYTVNPYFLLAKSFNTNNVDNFLGQVTIDYKPVKGLDLVSRVGTNFTNSFIELKTPKYQFADNFINEDGTSGKSDVGRYYESSERDNDLNIDVYANYKNDFGKKKHFNFNVIGGFNYVDRRTSILTGSTNSGLIFADKYDLTNSNGQPFVTDFKAQRRLAGIYANLNLGYRNLLFLEYSARNDWSSTLPVGKRGFFYQSGGISFVPTELFKTPNKWLSYLKIRANAGSVGKDARIGDINTTVALNPQFDDFGNPTYQYLYPMQVRDTTFTGLTVQNAAGNDKIKPEVTTTYEGGIDITALEDRLTLAITAYYQLSKNQIVVAPSSPSSGFSAVLQNIGKVSNKGVELHLDALLLKDLKGVNWSVYFNYAMNRSKVIKVSSERDEVQLGTGSTTVSLVAKEGQPFGIFKAETYLRDSLGRIMLNFANGLPLPGLSQGYFASFQPKYTMGFGSSFSWKGLSVSVAFDLRKGGVFWSGSKGNGEFSGTTISTLLNDRVPFVHPNTSYTDPSTGKIVANTSLASPVDVNYFSALPESDNLIDASYIKLREVNIGYSIPSKFFKNSPISNISIGAFGRNLKTWVPKSNAYADPEIGSFDGANSNAQGFETSTAPYSRSYGFDFKIGF